MAGPEQDSPRDGRGPQADLTAKAASVLLGPERGRAGPGAAQLAVRAGSRRHLGCPPSRHRG